MANGTDGGERINRILVGSETREAGYIMPHPHCHSYFELFFVESGACRFFIENDMYGLHTGDFILIPPGVFHYTRYTDGACRRSVIHFYEKHIWREVKELMPQGGKFFAAMRIFQVPETYREQILGHLLRMINERKIADGRSDIMLAAQLNELFLICCRECVFLNEIPERIHTTDREIVKAAQFISAHYTEHIGAEDIAAAAGYSPNYLSRKFRKAVGLGIHEYLTFVRLRAAALELVTTGDSVTDIAFRCGFSDSNYFKDAFKKKYGLTPREYRKS